MQRWHGLAALVALGVSPLLLTAAEQPEAAAEASAVVWLNLIDSADYGGSWDAAAPIFRYAITKAQWDCAAAAARTPLGRPKSRNLHSASDTKSFAGAPDGEYVVIKSASTFDNRAVAIETITPLRDAEGVWRVAGYYIR